MRRVKRVAVTPEQIGLCGCWQVVAIERTVTDLTKPNAQPVVTVGYYATSLTVPQHAAKEVGEMVREHWSAIENGTHHRRDVTFGEDACRVQPPRAAAALASLRNLAIGCFELARQRAQTVAKTLKSWCQRQTFGTAWRALAA